MPEELVDPKQENQPSKKPELSPDEVRKWLKRARWCLAQHRKELVPKYKQAKRRYNSEIGYANVTSTTKLSKHKASHNDINLLFKDVKEFIASIFFRNPEIDLTPRSEDPKEVANIENLEQLVNDDIKDRETELKMLLRSTLVDESLSGMAAIYIDYDYSQNEAVDDFGQPIPLNGVDGVFKQDVIRERVMVTKIGPENVIRPPWINYYNYKSSYYLGYVDIVTLDSLKSDSSLNQENVMKIKGKTYKSLLDTDIEDQEKNKEVDDDALHAKVYYIFIKGNDKKPIKRLVICEDEELDGQYLDYSDWDKGHGEDDRGYPIHLLQLNEGADSFIPPSEAWILEPILQIIDYIFGKINRHLKKSSTKYLARTGSGGLDKATLEKWIRNSDLEVLGVENLPPGIDIKSVVNQIVDQPLSADHNAQFELAKAIFDNLSRQPSATQASVINRKKTATESENIQQADSTENGDYIDKFKDFLKDVFYDWCKLRQKNIQTPVDITVEKESGEKEVRPLQTSENLQGRFKADIDVNSFLPPNKALKRQQVREIVGDMATILPPILRQTGRQLNGQKVLELYTDAVDVRDPYELTVPIPVRNIDQQVSDFVTKNIPFNPEELGEDTQKSMQRGLEIFADGELMKLYELAMPGISGPESPIIGFIKDLEMINQQKQGGPMKSPAKSPMRQEAGMMASAQRVA